MFSLLGTDAHSKSTFLKSNYGTFQDHIKTHWKVEYVCTTDGRKITSVLTGLVRLEEKSCYHYPVEILRESVPRKMLDLRRRFQKYSYLT